MKSVVAFGLMLAMTTGVGTMCTPSTNPPPVDDPYAQLYGNGSAGVLSVTANRTLSGQEAARQYSSIIIAPGATLTVPSMTILRCSANFTNNGTVVVLPGNTAGSVIRAQSGNDAPVFDVAPRAGIAASAATYGRYGSNAANRAGGSGGNARGLSQLEQLIRLDIYGNAGGGGAGSASGAGGRGGGGLTVFSRGRLTNAGAIIADGEAGGAGSGGGGGGAIILASSETIVNTGLLRAIGGNGGAPGTSSGGGGGGGGGLTHLLAPTLDTAAGTYNVAAGSATDSPLSFPVTNSPRSGGGGGGGSAGDGGTGDQVLSTNAVIGNTGGSIGRTFFSAGIDPVNVFD